MTPISCGRTSSKLNGEDQTSADIVDEFADDHEVRAHAFLEGWQVITSIHSRCHLVRIRQLSGTFAIADHSKEWIQRWQSL